MIKELVTQIRSERKWYAITDDEKDRVWLINTSNRILKGTAKKNTIEKFLSKFGYSIEFKTIINKK